MKIKEMLDKTIVFFKNKNFESARLDAELLICHALKIKNRVDLYVKFDQPLSEEEINLSRDYVVRRSKGEPVAYILGHKDFYHHQFLVSSSVLIPRPETELLVEEAITWSEEQAEDKDLRILDLGCGSGCIGLSLAKHNLKAHVTLVDISEEALETAKKNALHLQVEKQCEFILSDVQDLKFSPHSFDIIVGNPPYIAPEDTNVDENVKKFEPHIALFAEENGLKKLKSWTDLAKSWVKQPGLVLFEMGKDQGPQMLEHFKQTQTFSQVRIKKDFSGFDRHIIGVIEHG